ncbi:MAG: collagen-like protein [Bacteroidales bacterium]|nr:collagen-like protein [Bacteroidales bacterium]
MKKKIYQMPRIAVLLFTFLIFTFSACEGPEGPVGPQGATGSQGSVGPQGPAGDVDIQSKTYTVFNSNWSTSGSRADAYLYPSFLTSDIVNNGVVLVFMKDGGGTNSWQSIPYTWSDGSVYRYWYTTQEVNLEYIDGYDPGSRPGYDMIFKVIAFGGSYKSSLPEGLDLTDHDAVFDFINFQK